MRVRIKFCGMTRREDLLAASDLGADSLGLVFVPGTPRFLDLARARELLRGCPPLISRVGVFADEDPMRVRRIRDELGLSAVQLHGSESPGHCATVGGPLIKVFRVSEGWDRRALDRYDCEACLLEATPSVAGGKAPFDWERFRGGFPGRRVILAGGLTPQNVANAVRVVRPYGVDVSRGIESAPGVKDPSLMEAFLQAVREAER
jgi:phosphoribosylanthranilate isomerase